MGWLLCRRGLSIKAGKIHSRLWFPAACLVLGNHCREDPATDIPACGQAHEPRFSDCHHVVEDLVGDRLVKGALITVRPHVELERLELEVLLFGNVVQAERGEVGLTGQRAQAGELGNFNMDQVVSRRLWVGESLEFLGWLAGHELSGSR